MISKNHWNLKKPGQYFYGMLVCLTGGRNHIVLLPDDANPCPKVYLGLERAWNPSVNDQEDLVFFNWSCNYMSVMDSCVSLYISLTDAGVSLVRLIIVDSIHASTAVWKALDYLRHLRLVKVTLKLFFCGSQKCQVWFYENTNIFN